MQLLDLPAPVLEGVARALRGDARKPLRASCRELRSAANAATDFIRVDFKGGDQQQADGCVALATTCLPALAPSHALHGGGCLRRVMPGLHVARAVWC
jgi:hypothetical protein